MSSNLYAPVSELRDRLGLTDSSQDFSLDLALQSASRWIDRTLGRRFYAVSETRYYTACKAYWYLETDDLLSVTELATDADGNGTYETIWTVGTDYWLAPRNAPLDAEPYTCINRTSATGRFSFPGWRDAVKITGSFGYCTIANVPPQIRDLCLSLAENGAGSVGGSDLVIPGVQSYKIGNELSVTMGTNKLADSNLSILTQFRRGNQLFVN